MTERRRFFPATPVQRVPGRTVELEMQLRPEVPEATPEPQLAGDCECNVGGVALLGLRIIPESWYMAEGGFYSNCGLMLFPPMALIIVGCIIWVHRSRNKDLQEK